MKDEFILDHEELRDFEDRIELEGGERGEYWGRLMDLSTYDYAMSDEFKAAYMKELKECYDCAKNDFDIIEEEVTLKTTVRILEEREV